MDDTSETEIFPPNNISVDIDETMIVGRQGYLDVMKQRLIDEKVIAISGIGGAGKTTLTCLYAEKNRREYKNGILFVDSSKMNMLSFNFADLAGPDVLDLVPHPEQDIKRSLKVVSDFISHKNNFLLIYDEADDVNILEELSRERSDGLCFIPPASTLRGHIIITSRCHKELFKSILDIDVIHLDDLSVQDTETFLWRRVYGDECAEQNSSDKLYLRSLCKTHLASHLPLYVEQIASHIRGGNMSFEDYLHEILQRVQAPIGSVDFGDNRRGIEERFISTYDRIEQKHREASILMNFAALCHSRDIPISLFSMLSYTLQKEEQQGKHLEKDGDTLADFLKVEMQKTGYTHGASFDFETICKAGEKAVKTLLEIPQATQLVNFMKTGRKFTMHAIIQNQLRARLERQQKMTQSLTTLTKVFLEMLSSNHILPANKRSILVHADQCGEHTKLVDSPDHQLVFMKLRIKTAHCYAALDLTDVAWKILDEVNQRLSRFDHLEIRRELFVTKAKFLIWQHRGRDAMEVALQGLRLFPNATEYFLDLNIARQYAVLNKSCAHAMIMNEDPSLKTIDDHFSQAKRGFEYVLEKDEQSGIIEFATMLMMQGKMHVNQARMYDNDSRHSVQELTTARDILSQALLFMDSCNGQEGNNILCHVHIIFTDVKLRRMSHMEAIEEVKKWQIHITEKLGPKHRHTAWLMKKLGQLLLGNSEYSAAIAILERSLSIQMEAYGESGGAHQKGTTALCIGKALLALGETENALKSFADAQMFCSSSPKFYAFREAKESIGKMTRASQGI